MNWTGSCGASCVVRQSDRKLNVRLVTDAFPPGGGGSGWSTYYLGKALADLGHSVGVVRPVYAQSGAGRVRNVTSYGGLRVDEIGIPTPPDWIAKIGLARGWEEMKAIRQLSRYCTQLACDGKADVLHGQHTVSGIATTMGVRAARRKGAQAISVITVRDYWPLCPSSTRLVYGGSAAQEECVDCHKPDAYLSCVSKGGIAAKTKAVGAARWLRTRARARTLAQCDAIIGVSKYVQSELARSGRFDAKKMVAIPNLVDLESVDAALEVQVGVSPDLDGDYLFFAGKLDPNKGAQLLPGLVEAAGVQLPLLIAGDGQLKAAIQREAAERGLDFRFLDWTDNDSVLRLMQTARCLLFPSCWQEPLSRVLLEASASRAAIVALDTGGTSEVIRHMESGWLVHDTVDFVEGIRRVCTDDSLNRSLRRGARKMAEEKFAEPIVSRQIEELYRTLLGRLEVA